MLVTIEAALTKRGMILATVSSPDGQLLLPFLAPPRPEREMPKGEERVRHLRLVEVPWR